MALSCQYPEQSLMTALQLFHVDVAADSMSVRLDCEVPGDDREGLAEAIESELRALRIHPLPEPEALRNLIELAYQQQRRIQQGVLVEGIAPVPPRHARLEWAREFFSGDFALDDFGRIDYRRPVGNPSVVSGEELARYWPALEGRAGVDVFGHRLTVERPQRMNLRAGANVREEPIEDGVRLVADVKGRLRWNGTTLMIDRVLTISGNVGLETGHIDHPGTVIVHGDVLTGSRIRADGDVEIAGSVEPAMIQAGGNLKVGQGVTGAILSGGTECRLIAGGSVQARFLRETYVEAGEDVSVENEILHSTVRTRGAIRMPGGRAVGGELIALRGILLGQAGSDKGIRTRLVSGDDFELPIAQKKMRGLLLEHQRTIDKIKCAIDPLIMSRVRLSQQQQDLVTMLSGRIVEFEDKIQDIHLELADLEKHSRERARHRIIIQQWLFPESVLCMKGLCLELHDQYVGPLRAVTADGRIDLLAE